MKLYFKAVRMDFVRNDCDVTSRHVCLYRKIVPAVCSDCKLQACCHDERDKMMGH